MAAKLSAKASPYYSNLIGDAKIVVGAENANSVVVNMGLKDANSKNLAKKGWVAAYLSDSSVGAGITATPPGVSVTASIGTIVQTGATPVAWICSSDVNGQLSLNIQHATAKTWYLVVLLPAGSTKV